MSRLAENLEAEIDRQSLLKHPFYKMWSEGKLSEEDLAGYSKEYFQLVRAVPELVKNVRAFVKDARTRRLVDEIMAEEQQHVEMWAKFAESLGVSREVLMAYRGTPKTRRALSKVRALSRASFVSGASAMYSIESEQPKISRTKLDGLVAFYGMSADGEGTLYFREHEVADVRHAAVWRALLTKTSGRREEESLASSTEALAAQNAILDSVMETYVSEPMAC